MKEKTTPRLTCFAGLILLANLPASAATLLFADNFNRANDSDLNASTGGKSGTLGALAWNEVTGLGDVSIATNRLSISSGTGTTLSGVPYVDNNFIGLTSLTVSFDLISAANSGSNRALGFGIGNAKANLDALASSGPFGDIGISFDLANTLNTTRGIQIFENGSGVTYIERTLATNDTLSAVFTFADMNSGTAITYEVFHNGASVYTGSHAWSGTDQNYIGFFNSHRTNNSSVSVIDNFAVEGVLVPEPSSFLLVFIGLLPILRRRR